jgi:hypothetical protein
MVRPWAKATGGSWLTPSVTAEPAPIKISAKVPMNSAASIRFDAIAPSFIANTLKVILESALARCPA